MTPAELAERWRHRAADAERVSATVPLAVVLRELAGEVEQVDGVPTPTEPAPLWTLEDTAKYLTVPVRWFSEGENKRLPFLRHVSRKQVRVCPRALMRWLASRE